MISKSEIKFITSLRQKKCRDEHGVFFAEGPKVVNEFIYEGFRIHSYYSTDPEDLTEKAKKLITPKELQRISSLKTPNTCLAVFDKPLITTPQRSGLTVALDAVRDPGNLGTIIRLCDWFGVPRLVCSTDTADCYNPKVVQATMGSLARVTLEYCDLVETLSSFQQKIYGAVMDGDKLYDTELNSDAVIVLGNESHGISDEVASVLDGRITIPRHGKLQRTESLNVATAAAVILAEFRRSTGR